MIDFILYKPEKRAWMPESARRPNHYPTIHPNGKQLAVRANAEHANKETTTALMAGLASR